MMLATVYNMAGEPVGEYELPDDIFGIKPHRAVMHQALERQLANARLGTHKTKTRGEVRGGGRKPWRQKGTGRARHGSIRSPIWVGGGVVFGPRPRKYTKRMPKKMRRLALRSALSVKAQAGQLILVDKLTMERPKTREMAEVLDRLTGDRGSVLILMPGKDLAVEKSVSNLPYAKTLHARYLNIRDLLGYDYVIAPLDAIAVIEGFLGQREVAQ
jgi:large subunit ribosomal protein L4